MTMFFMYLGGCAVIAFACFLVSKYIQGPPQAVNEVVTDGSSIAREEDLIADTPESAILREKRKQEILSKDLLETKTRIEKLQLQYRDKYNVDLTDLAASKNSNVSSSTTKKRGIRTRKRESGTSCSSNESSTLTPSTVIHKPIANGGSSAETFVLDDASSVYNSANNTSFSKEVGSVQNDPLGGKPEVAPIDKVEQWLQNNSERKANLSHDQSVKDEKVKTRPKPVLMIIPARDPPRSKGSADSDCETYAPTCKKESPKTNAPHLYKRLNLRKKSSGESVPSKRMTRKSEVGNKEVPNTPKDKVKTPSIPGKSCNRQTDLKEQKLTVKNKAQTDEDSDRETLVNYVCEAYNSSESDHFIEPTRTASFELEANTLYNKNLGRMSSDSSGRYPPYATRQQDSVGKAKSFESSSSRSRSSHKTKEIIESTNVQSKPVDKQKSSPAVVNKRSKSASSKLSDLSETNKNCFGNDIDGEVIWPKKATATDIKRERKPKSERPASSNRERLPSNKAVSGEELDWRAKCILPEKKGAVLFQLIKKVSGSNSNASDKKTEAPGKNNVPKCSSNERPMSADEDKLSPRSLSEKSKEFLKKYRLRNSSGHERSKSDEIKETDSKPKLNRFEMRKEFQAKYRMKETSDNSNEKDTLTSTSTQPEKRKLFQAKYHIKCAAPEDEPSRSDKIESTKSNQIEKKKDLQAKNTVKDVHADQERPKTAGNEDLMQQKSEKRKEALAQYRNKYVDNPAKSKSHGNVLPSVKPDTKGNDMAQGAKKEEANEKPRKMSPLQRRMAYDAKCRMKSASNLHKPNTPTEEILNVKTILREKKQNYNSKFRIKANDPNSSRPATSEKPRPSSPVSKQPDSKSQKTVEPTMNRQPNDQGRLAYVFDWDTKVYVIAKTPEGSEDEDQASEPVKTRESVPPRTKKKLPPPRGVRRPMSATERKDSRPSSASSGNKDSNLIGMRKLATGSEDECRYVRRNKGSEWSLSSSSNQSKGSVAFEFDVKGLNDSNVSTSVSSELSEDSMIKELQNARAVSNKVGGEFIMPKCQSAHLRNKPNTGSKLQNILDTPMNSGGVNVNDNLLSRSDAKFPAENENTKRDQVFTGATALNRSTKSLLHNGSKEIESVLTTGFKKLALDESLGEKK